MRPPFVVSSPSIRRLHVAYGIGVAGLALLVPADRAESPASTAFTVVVVALGVGYAWRATRLRVEVHDAHVVVHNLFRNYRFAIDDLRSVTMDGESSLFPSPLSPDVAAARFSLSHFPFSVTATATAWLPSATVRQLTTAIKRRRS